VEKYMREIYSPPWKNANYMPKRLNLVHIFVYFSYFITTAGYRDTLMLCRKVQASFSYWSDCDRQSQHEIIVDSKLTEDIVQAPARSWEIDTCFWESLGNSGRLGTPVT